MHWIERIVRDLEKRGDERIVLSTGKTPSGYVHIGISRELIYCSSFERLLKQRGLKTKFLFFIDSLDPVKKFPPYIPSSFVKYIGMPMSDVPCPEGCCGSYAEHFGNLLIKNLAPFGLDPDVIWSHKLYATKGMLDLVRKALTNVDVVRNIFIDVVGPTLPPDQLEQYKERVGREFPCQVVCKGCGRMTKVTSFDATKDTVHYSCKWCNETGSIPLKKAKMKLTWRVDWPAKWALFKVSCEPAGKDHCVKGGAYDTGEEICRKLFGWKGPYRVSFEWFLLGGRAMKTHKGISFTWDEWLSVAPPENLRYLVLRQSPRKHISFQPELVPQLIDEFERFETIYYGKEKASKADRDKVKLVYPLCLPKGATERIPIRLPYRFATIFSQVIPLMGEDKIIEKATTLVKRKYDLRRLSKADLQEIHRSIERGGYWVKHYAPEHMKIEIPKKVSEEIKSQLSEKQKRGLGIIAKRLEEEELEEQVLQNRIFKTAREVGLKPAELFRALYLVFLGKSFGPRLAPFLLSIGRDVAVGKIKEALT